MTTQQLATWFCVAVVSATSEEQTRLADELSQALEPLTDQERMRFYGKLFTVPDCHSAKPDFRVSNGDRPIDMSWNYVTEKETVER